MRDTTESEVKCIVCRQPVLATHSQFGYGSEVVYHKHCDGVFNDIERAVRAQLEALTQRRHGE